MSHSLGGFSVFSKESVDKLFNIEVTFEEEKDEGETTRVEPIIDHAGKFTAHMSTLRLDVSSTDMTLLTTADGRSFPAHKLILSARSPVFGAMFRNGEFTENQKKLVEIDDISGEVMEALLKYVYELNVKGIEGIADKLLVAADKVRQ